MWDLKEVEPTEETSVDNSGEETVNTKTGNEVGSSSELSSYDESNEQK